MLCDRMAYIEENMKLRRGEKQEEDEDAGPTDPYAELFRLTEQYKAAEKKKEEEGNVTNSLAMLTAIPEVDLGMECVQSIALLCVGALTSPLVAHVSRTSKRQRKRSARCPNSGKIGTSRQMTKRTWLLHAVRCFP